MIKERIIKEASALFAKSGVKGLTMVTLHFFNSRALEISRDDRFPGKLTLNEVFESMAVIFLRGICTAKGLEIIDKYYNK